MSSDETCRATLCAEVPICARIPDRRPAGLHADAHYESVIQQRDHHNICEAASAQRDPELQVIDPLPRLRSRHRHREGCAQPATRKSALSSRQDPVAKNARPRSSSLPTLKFVGAGVWLLAGVLSASTVSLDVFVLIRLVSLLNHQEASAPSGALAQHHQRHAVRANQRIGYRMYE